MLNIIQNTIGAIRRVGESVVRAGLKMWLPFTKAEHLGREAVSDNSFNDTNEWLKESGWTVSGGLATRTNIGSYSALQQHCLVSGTTYQVTIVIDSITSGEFFGVRLGTNYIIRDKTSANTYQGIGVANSTLLSIMGDINFAGTISSISIKEATQISTDLSGNNNDAILKTGKALQFTGNDSVQTSFPSSYTIKTIAFWINPTHSSTDETVFYGGGGQYSTRQLYLNHLDLESETQHIAMNTYVNGSLEGVTYYGTPATLTQDEWQRVVLTSSTGFSVVSDTFDVGSGLYGSDGRFIMSDLQIYDEAWTTDDIAYDYANPQKLVTDSENTSITLDNLKAWWHLSEGDGTIAFDSAPLIGKELVVNGGFSNDSDWTVYDREQTSSSGWGISNGAANYDGTGSQFNRIYQGFTTVVGRTYKMTFTLSGLSGNSVNFGFGNWNGSLVEPQIQYGSNGTYTRYMVADRTDHSISIQNNTATQTFSIDNVSVKEVYNIDGETYDGSSLGASYVDAQERIPQLGMMNWSKGSNLITYSEDLTEWTLGSNATLTYESDVVAPDGTVGVYRLLLPAQGSTFLQSPTYAAGSGRVFSMWVKKTDNNNSQFNFYDGSQSSTTFTATNEWERFEMTGQAGTNSYVLNTGDTFITDIYIWGGQVESSTGMSVITASAYRRTNGTAVTNATLISSATDSQKDILGNAVRVKGSGFNLDGTGYAEVLDDASINPTNEITLGCWVYLDSKSDKGIVAKWSAGELDYMLYKHTATTIKFYVGSDDLTHYATPTSGWVYIVGTYDGSNMKTYTLRTDDVDSNGDINIRTTTRSRTGAIPNNSNNLEIGRYYENQSFSYSEKIDSVILYDVALEQAEVIQNFNATKSGHNN